MKEVLMKMEKRILIAAIALSMCLTACGTAKDSKTTESDTPATTVSEETETTESETEQETETTKPETENETETTEKSAEKDKSTAQSEEFVPVKGLSEKYGDIENRAFAYEGKIFTLGKSTMKDLIDGGIPFDEKELNNKGNNVNKNHESSRYTVRINDYVTMQFVFLNSTDSNITEEECLLCNVRWYPIYVPQPDYDESLNEEIVNSINDAAKHVCFSFPLTLTKEQLLENNSNTTEEDQYNNVEYTVDSEVYMGDSGYKFNFNDKTNQLKEVRITWLP